MNRYYAECEAHEATKPLVSFRARRWDIMERFGYTNEAEAAKDPRCTGQAFWEDDNPLYEGDVAMSWCEYLYVIDIDARTFGVYTASDPMVCGGVFSLDGDEPDWGALFPEED